jgi:putative transposase
VLVRKGFRFRLYPTQRQAADLDRWESALRFLWNLANEQRLIGLARPRDERKYITAFDQINELTGLRAELPWLAEVPRNVCAQLLVELDKAWQRCFKKLADQPRWKQKGRDTLGLCEPHPKVWRLSGNKLHFPKVGSLKIVVHRPLEGKSKTCTVRRDGDQWFASILCENEISDPSPRAVPVVAIDRGITNLLADSEGRTTCNPFHLEKSLKRLRRVQHIADRRKKGSKNRTKALDRVSRIHRKVKRQRDYVLHELSTAYAKSHGTVVVEKLNVRGMLKNHCLARRIAGAGWSRFANMLRYKLAWNGGRLVEVPAAYSSQTCSHCGNVSALSRCGERFCCVFCGYVDHADLNAAKVLKQRFDAPVLHFLAIVPGDEIASPQLVEHGAPHPQVGVLPQGRALGRIVPLVTGPQGKVPDGDEIFQCRLPSPPTGDGTSHPPDPILVLAEDGVERGHVTWWNLPQKSIGS